MIKQFRELWTIMRSDPAINHRLPELKRLAIKSFGWTVAVEIIMVLRMLPLMFFVNWLSDVHRDWRILLLIAAGTLVLYLANDELDNRMSTCRNRLDWYQWSIWWSYGHRQELRQSADWHIKHGTGEKESLVAKNIGKFQHLIDQLIFATIPGALRVLFVWAAVWFIGWQWGIVTTVTLVAYAVVLVRTERKLEAARVEHREELRKVEVFGSELTNNWATIKDLGSEERQSDKNDGLLFDFVEHEDRRGRKQIRLYTRQGNVLSLSRAVLFLTVGFATLWYQPSIGGIVLATGWLEQMYSNLWRFVDLQMLTNQGLVALKELVGVMKQPPTVRQSDNPIDPTGMEPAIRIKNLGFHYPEAPDKVALEDINIDIPAYSSVAIVGMSGSGKSTLMRMLQRQFDPSEGSIEIGGTDLRDIDLGAYREQYCGVVSQQTRLFSGTVADNIRMGKPDATQYEIYQAAKKAHALEFIMRLPGEFNAQIGENGINLSGGQAQRLALARLFVRQPKIAILDEPTSAQDAEIQDHVKDSFNQMIKDRESTTLIVAHRFSTIMGVDLVIVMDKGRIVEVGTHQELHRKNGKYAHLRQLESHGLLAA